MAQAPHGRFFGRIPPPGLFLAALLAAAVLLAYAPALSGPFVLDDSGTVIGNRSLREFPGPGSLVPPRGSSVAGRPVAHLSFAANYAACGLRPACFRLVNIGIHILAALFLFGLAEISLADRERFPGLWKNARPIAFFSALVFALSPLQTGAVAYITQRVESLSAMLCLGALYFAARGFSSERKNAWHGAAALFLLLAAGSKESMAAMPLAIWLYDVVIRGSKPGRALARSPLLYAGCAASLALLAALVATGRQAATVHSSYTCFDYFLAQPGSLGLYLRLLVFPAGLCFDRWGLAAGPEDAIVWGLVLAAAFVYAAMGLLKKRPAAFLVAWFFLALAPSSSFYPLAEAAAEYRAYPALAPLSVLACAALFGLAGRLFRQRGRLAASAFLALFCASLFWATWERSTVFASAESLWEDTLAKDPENPRAMVNLGRVREKAGHYRDAIDLYRKAINTDPGLPKAYANLGHALLKSGRPEEALEQFSTSLALDPENAGVLAYTGEALLELRREAEARVFLEKALALYPGLPLALKLLGRLEGEEPGRPAGETTEP